MEAIVLAVLLATGAPGHPVVEERPKMTLSAAVRQTPVPDIADAPRVRASYGQRPPLRMTRRRASRGAVVAVGAALGAAAGFWLGYAMTTDGDGEGALLGLPVGAVAGGLLTFRLTR